MPRPNRPNTAAAVAAAAAKARKRRLENAIAEVQAAGYRVIAPDGKELTPPARH